MLKRQTAAEGQPFEVVRNTGTDGTFTFYLAGGEHLGNTGTDGTFTFYLAGGEHFEPNGSTNPRGSRCPFIGGRRNTGTGNAGTDAKQKQVLPLVRCADPLRMTRQKNRFSPLRPATSYAAHPTRAARRSHPRRCWWRGRRRAPGCATR